MQIVSVDSSAVLKVGYGEDALFVQFVGGDWYKYRHVPKIVFEQLIKANSVGRFIDKEIKPKYKDVERLLVSPEA